MVLSRIFHETDAKGREHVNKQYIQEYEIKPFSEYVTFLTTRNREKAKEMTREEIVFMRTQKAVRSYQLTNRQTQLYI